jgi:lipopolysaccharide transport system permease protein
LTESAGSLIANTNLISKIYFPRLIVPFAAVITALVDFVITLGMLALLMAWYGFGPGWQLLFLPLLVLWTLALALGAGLLLAALNVSYRDFRYVVPFIVQFGLFVSPLAFTTAQVPESWRMLYSANPLAGIIDGFRWSILGGQTPLDSRTLGMSMAMTIVFLAAGLWYFRRVERGFADVI